MFAGLTIIGQVVKLEDVVGVCLCGLAVYPFCGANVFYE